jgi:hypothetical protein
MPYVVVAEYLSEVESKNDSGDIYGLTLLLWLSYNYMVQIYDAF